MQWFGWRNRRCKIRWEPPPGQTKTTMQASLWITDLMGDPTAPFATMPIEKGHPQCSPDLSPDKESDANQIKWSVGRAFHEYLRHAYDRHCGVESEWVQASRRLEECYLPLKVRPARGKGAVVIDRFDKLFLTHKRALLLGPPGAGKTTALRFIFSDCLTAKVTVPFFVELRRLSSTTTILDVVKQEVKGVNDVVLTEIIRRGGFVFLLDGLNEIAQAHRDEVIRPLLDFLSTAEANYFVVTARPDTPLVAHLNFPTWTIDPLRLTEAFALLRRRDQHGRLSRYIIGKVKQDQSKHLGEFLTNPLRVSMLYRSYELIRQAEGRRNSRASHRRQKYRY